MQAYEKKTFRKLKWNALWKVAVDTDNQKPYRYRNLRCTECHGNDSTESHTTGLNRYIELRTRNGKSKYFTRFNLNYTFLNIILINANIEDVFEIKYSYM